MAISRAEASKGLQIAGGLLAVGGLGAVVVAVFASKLPVLKDLSVNSRQWMLNISSGVVLTGSVLVAVGTYLLPRRSGGTSSVLSPETRQSQVRFAGQNKFELPPSSLVQGNQPTGQGLPINEQGEVDVSSLSEELQGRLTCIIFSAVPADPMVYGEEGRLYSEHQWNGFLDSNRDKTELHSPIGRYNLKKYNWPGGGIVTQYTAIPDRTIRDFIRQGRPLQDPFSGRQFGMAYICKETGYTYNIDDLRRHLQGLDAGQTFTCPISGVQVSSLTLYPNLALWGLDGSEAPKPAAGASGFVPECISGKSSFDS